jgi:hypothetical protein
LEHERPPAVVVSIASVSERNPHLLPFQVFDGLDQLLERARQPVELPDDQRVTLARIVERCLQLGPVPLRATAFSV